LSRNRPKAICPAKKISPYPAELYKFYFIFQKDSGGLANFPFPEKITIISLILQFLRFNRFLSRFDFGKLSSLFISS
jgi:hypothetical protein